MRDQGVDPNTLIDAGETCHRRSVQGFVQLAVQTAS